MSEISKDQAVAVSPAEERELKNEIREVVTTATELAKIETHESCEQAGAFLVEIKKGMKHVDEKFNESLTKAQDVKKAAEAARKELVSLIDEIKAPAKKAEVILKNAIGKFYLKMKAEQEAEEKRLADIAAKEAEEAALEDAVEAEKEGDHEEAEAILNEPPAPVATVATDMKPKAAGVGVSMLYRADVLDIKKLCQAVADGTAPIGAVEANMTFLNRYATMMKKEFKVPGCQLIEKPSVGARG